MRGKMRTERVGRRVQGLSSCADQGARSSLRGGPEGHAEWFPRSFPHCGNRARSTPQHARYVSSPPASASIAERPSRRKSGFIVPKTHFREPSPGTRQRFTTGDSSAARGRRCLEECGVAFTGHEGRAGRATSAPCRRPGGAEQLARVSRGRNWEARAGRSARCVPSPRPAGRLAGGGR